MIQIQSQSQFRNAAARLAKEKMSVRRYERTEAGTVYAVRNVTKGHDYLVRFERRGAHLFGTCTCEAGTPTKGERIPQVCKHLFAALLLHRATVIMRRAVLRRQRELAEALAVLAITERPAERVGAFTI